MINQLKEAFGEDVAPGGKPDRALLASRAFACEEKTKLLNSITHPEITRLTIEEIHEAQESGAKAAVIDAPVLFESPLTCLCKKIICVTADEKERLERIMLRDGISREKALERIKAQRSEEYYVSKSDIIIRNSDIDDTRDKTVKIAREELL